MHGKVLCPYAIQITEPDALAGSLWHNKAGVATPRNCPRYRVENTVEQGISGLIISALAVIFVFVAVVGVIYMNGIKSSHY